MLRRLAILAVLIAIGIAGCSTTGQVVEPQKEIGTFPGSESHMTWGTWQFVADPEMGTLDVVPLRTSEMHINALPFLEPPPLVNLTLESLKIVGNIVDADIGLRHPFLGLDEFTGFDVCGLLITNGSLTGFNNPGLIMSGEGDTRLLNPDGYARWWNPAEFPHGNTMFSYKDGLLGTPDSAADYNATVNAYKLFCNDLTDPNASVGSLDPGNRCVFSAGQKNIRHYTIELGTAGLVFNYAVDACWKFPDGGAPWQVPDDFGPEANRPEAWNVVVTELGNTLWNDGTSSGGDLSLLIDVWDHYNASLNTVKVESPGNINLASASTPIDGGEGFSTYQIDITNATPGQGTIDLLIEVECEQAGYQDFISGQPVTAYFTYTADVSSQGFLVTSPNGGEIWDGLHYHDITWIAPDSIGFIDIYYSKDDFNSDNNLIKDNVANTGSYSWFVPNDPSTTVKVKIKESGGALEDTSDNYFTIVKGGCDFGADGFTFTDHYQPPYPDVPAWMHNGTFCSKQDPTQRLFCRNFYNPDVGNNGGIIMVFNASNPVYPVTQYDTGTDMNTNSTEVMWIDSLSEPGYDRLIYHHNGDSGFHWIDWDGSDLIDPPGFFSNSTTGGVCRCCLQPNGDFIVMGVSWNNCYFYLFDKSNSYSQSFLFEKYTTDFTDFSSGAWVQKIAYNPTLDAIMLMYKDPSYNEQGKLYVVDANDGTVLVDYLTVFELATNIGAMGMNVDMENPDCRVIIYTDQPDYSGNAWIVRYSGDLTEKVTYSYNNPYFYFGPCNGDLQTDGTLWAAPSNGTGYFYKFSPPPDW